MDGAQHSFHGSIQTAVVEMGVNKSHEYALSLGLCRVKFLGTRRAPFSCGHTTTNAWDVSCSVGNVLSDTREKFDWNNTSAQQTTIAMLPWSDMKAMG